MSLGRPISEFGNPTCPKCGTVQESPGSTVCEQCGQDLTLSGVNKPPTSKLAGPRRSAPRAARSLIEVPMHLTRRVFWTIQSIVSLIWRLITLTLRTAVVLIILGALVVGLSYVPDVRARVPLIEEAPRIAKQLLVSAGLAGSRWLASVASSRGAQSTSSQARTSQPAVSPTKTAPARAVALQLLTVKSTPTGATVQLNARQVGKTPISIKVAAGTYKVTVSRRGYSSVTRTIIVTKGKAVSVNVTLGQRQ